MQQAAPLKGRLGMPSCCDTRMTECCHAFPEHESVRAYETFAPDRVELMKVSTAPCQWSFSIGQM